MVSKITRHLALIAAVFAGSAHAATVYTVEPASIAGDDVVIAGVPNRAAFWCAAGRYALNTLGYSTGTQILLLDVEGRQEILTDAIRARFIVNPRRHGILPIGAGANMHVLVEGDYMTAGVAVASCQ
ncbi:hypothetical protein ACFORG_20060 [Lutimaribacter marinistellae]|uniref:Uncharacterized protein n=1 Tax=Lutimaribacter marinistellae TaxID=1820329 RepID=A0ABV7TM68_9RHOB